MKSIFKIIIGRTIGFIIFLILLGIANLFQFSELYNNIIDFFIRNLLLIFILFALGMINDIFWIYKYNILAPIVSALLSIFIVTFIYRMFNFLEPYLGFNISLPISLIYAIVFIAVLIGGYVTIITRLVTKPKGKKIEWSDVGNEFKLFFYSLGKELNTKPKKRKKKS